MSAYPLKKVCGFLMEDWDGDRTPQEIVDRLSELKRRGITDRRSADIFQEAPEESEPDLRDVRDIAYFDNHGHYPETTPFPGCKLCWPPDGVVK